MADIPLTKNWTPLGNDSSKFTGALNGNYYEITGLKITNATASYQGLFGYIGLGGKVSNLKLEGTITGKAYLGMIAGYNEGTIENVRVSGKVTTSDTKSGYDYIGGIVGYNKKGIISKCYNSAKVSGCDYIGGIVGASSGGTIEKSASSAEITGRDNVGGIVGYISNETNIKDVYTVGKVTGTSSSSYIGGIVGFTTNGSITITNVYSIANISGLGSNIGGIVGLRHGTIENAYWVPEMSGLQTSKGGISTTITWLINKANLEDKFDFEETWGIEDGETLPYLLGLPIPEEIYVINNEYVAFDGGTGTELDPYIIKTEAQLRKMQYELTSCYKLGNDITLTNNWTPIGNSENKFTGKLDGAGYAITGLKTTNATASYQGLFGYVGTGGKVSNLKLEGTITGKAYLGMVAGYNEGTIENVRVSGKVGSTTTSGYDDIGGIVGYNKKGTISKCYNSAKVSGSDYIGGIAGESSSGTIEKSASSAEITGRDYVGGIVGRSLSEINIKNVYTVGTVTATSSNSSYIGGIVGRTSNSYSTITNAYSIAKISCSGSYIGGIVGTGSPTIENVYWNKTKSGLETSKIGTELTDEDLTDQSKYIGFDFTSQAPIWVMKEYPELNYNFGNI